MARSARSNYVQTELEYALGDLREFRSCDTINAARGAFTAFFNVHKDEPWAGAMVDNYRRELLALNVDPVPRLAKMAHERGLRPHA